MNLIILGLIFDLVGVSILVIITIFNQSHQTTYPDTPEKRYITWWGPKIKFQKGKFKFSKYGYHKRKRFPPQHIRNAIGLLLIAIGFCLQIVGNLK
ncbi:hypothetical protein KAI04_03040 [Candidatus Pacearchaeota archaeon]|nr:hypothetical protein [Candidatus Pacearchaeota archaeon]